MESGLLVVGRARLRVEGCSELSVDRVRDRGSGVSREEEFAGNEESSAVAVIETRFSWPGTGRFSYRVIRFHFLLK